MDPRETLKAVVAAAFAGDAAALTDRQRDLMFTYQRVAMEYGRFDQTDGPDGAHYASAADNPFKSEGIMCQNCALYEGGSCAVVAGSIEAEAVCKLWIIPSLLIQEQPGG